MRRGVIDPPVRIVDPKLEPETQRQLHTIPPTGTTECLGVVKELGAALLPATAMVLLHEANSLGDTTLAGELEQRLVGRGTVDGEYENGVANPIIEGYARRFGFRTPDAIDDFRQECHLRMIRHIRALKGHSVMWETSFGVCMYGIASDINDWFQARERSRHPDRSHPEYESIEATPPLSRAPDPLLATEEAELRAAIAQALSRLPEVEADAVRRVDLNGESFASIARDLDVDEGTIRQRRARGINRLGLHLDPFRDAAEKGGHHE
jgi:RNA polymerase sigma factor (sigma-70 family)